MKWVELVVNILGALVGLFLIGFGVLLLILSATLGVVTMVAGVVLFLCTLIFRRQIARSIQRVGKYLWATKYGRWGLILSMVTIVAVGTLLVVQARHRETLNVLQYNGHAWNRMSTDTRQSLGDVWGTSSSDVFAVGLNGTIVHYDGNAWSRMSTDTRRSLTDVWGTSSSDVFAVGWDGTIVHYDGHAWSTMISGTSEHLKGVWGSSASDVFVVGQWDTILHYDGNAWSTIMHYDGNAWSAMTKAGTTGTFYAVWGSSASDVFAVGRAPLK